ncbi:MAG: isoprenylcysteine carboxylmethyltransferase family protein [Chloroflexi bacterium]|nr:isoprenylcysteine carboxylmethyltransferase family protein [Chloroflexota bacterium]
MSFLPGRDLFQTRSELGKPQNGLLALVTMGVTATLVIAFFFFFDGLFIGSTLISQGIVMFVGQILVAQMILRRDQLRARWGIRAFAIAFRWLALPGLTCILIGVAHFAWIEGARIVPREIAIIPFVYLLGSGILLWVRAVITFGIDNLSLMYVYFPNESRLVNSNVYSILRHPVYSAVLRFVFALVLWNGSAFALFAGCVAPIAMTVWLRWAEEAELIERFGDGYREYRARVPAFFNLNPKTWVGLWRFLVRGNKSQAGE